MTWIEDFEGERPEMEDLSTEKLREIRARTVEALHDPHDPAPKYLWRNQIQEIDEEIAWRTERT